MYQVHQASIGSNILLSTIARRSIEEPVYRTCPTNTEQAKMSAKSSVARLIFIRNRTECKPQSEGYMTRLLAEFLTVDHRAVVK